EERGCAERVEADRSALRVVDRLEQVEPLAAEALGASVVAAAEHEVAEIVGRGGEQGTLAVLAEERPRLLEHALRVVPLSQRAGDHGQLGQETPLERLVPELTAQRQPLLDEMPRVLVPPAREGEAAGRGEGVRPQGRRGRLTPGERPLERARALAQVAVP